MGYAGSLSSDTGLPASKKLSSLIIPLVGYGVAAFLLLANAVSFLLGGGDPISGDECERI